MSNVGSSLRWVARGLSVVSMGLLLLFLSDGFDPAQISWTEWVGLLFFPVGIVLGLAVGWWREGLGGAIAVASLLAFYNRGSR